MPMCNNCAGDFQGNFHIHGVMYNINFEVCSPACLHQLYIRWKGKKVSLWHRLYNIVQLFL